MACWPRDSPNVPVFRGTFGLSRGQQAIKVEERVRRIKSPMLENATLKKKA